MFVQVAQLLDTMNRYASIAIVASLLTLTGATDTCIHCICLQESGCKPIGFNMNGGSLTCGYYQIKLPYYEDCGQPGKNAGEDTEAAWKRCSNDYACATTCVQNYVKRYSSECGWGKDPCEVMARIHNGGPSGCSNPATLDYWTIIQKCCGCNCGCSCGCGEDGLYHGTEENKYTLL